MIKKILLIILLFNICINVKANTTEDNLETLVDNLLSASNNIFLNSHPVGSIYETTNSNESTAAKMAAKYGGTWEAYGTDKVLRGTTGTVDSTGGSSSVTLSASNIPTLSFSGTKAAQTVTSSSCTTCNGISVSGTFSYTTRTTSSAGAHSHGISSGGSFFGIDQSTTEAGYNHGLSINSAWWNGVWKTTVSIANSASHSHTYTDYYLSKVTGVGSHNHSATSAEQTISSTYTNNNQTNIDILDPYITIYRYKRVA